MTQERTSREKRAEAKGTAPAQEVPVSRDVVEALQGVLGARVLERSPTGVVLLQAGRQYFVVAQKLIQVNTLSLPYARQVYGLLVSGERTPRKEDRDSGKRRGRRGERPAQDSAQDPAQSRQAG